MEYSIHRFAALASTNDEASSDRYGHGDVVICDRQTKGRGQRGNGWHSTPDENLTFSLVTEPSFLPAASQFLLSETVSLAVIDTLNGYGITASIKWPNDIYIGDRKIAGILIENDICGSNLSRSVIGIGLNVNESGFPDCLPNPVSMGDASGRKFDLREVLDKFLAFFGKRFRMLEKGDTDRISGDYDRLVYRKGIRSSYRRASDEEFEGTIIEVRPNGLLVMETDDGTEKFLFKEIEFVL